MKILQVCPYFYPYLAGQERYVLQLSKKLSKYGECVEVFTTNHSDLPRFEVIENIPVRRFNMISAPLNNPISIDFLHAFNKMKSFDVIHIHNEHSFVSLITCLSNAFFRKPIVLTCHGQLRFGSKIYDLFERIYSKTVGKFIFNSVTKIVVLSNDDKAYISSFGIDESKISVLPNAIDIEHIGKFNLDKFDNIHKEFADKKLVLFVGRIIPRKGVEYIIKSVKTVASKFDDVIFVLVGDGNYKEKAEKLCDEYGVSSHVIFLTNLSEELLYTYYKISDVFILPSLSEGLPTTILEAMYFNVPVISTNIPGISEHFKDTAILISPKNEHELARSIIKVLDDPELKFSLSLKARTNLYNKYTWDIVSKSYLNIYSSEVKQFSDSIV